MSAVAEAEPYRERLESILEHLPAGIVIAESPSGRVAYRNRRAAELLAGAPPGEHEELTLAARGETVAGREVGVRAGDGTERTLRVSATPIRDLSGRVVMALAAYIDVTELHAARREAELADRCKEEFLAILSHELRTPLNAILGWTYLMRHPEGPADAEHALDVVWRNARALMRTVDDLLEVSRMVAGSLHLGSATLDLRRPVAAAIDAARTSADEKRQTLRADLGDEPLPARGDAIRLQRLAGNLIDNAVKFTPEGGHIEVTLRRDDERSEVTLAVEDSGEGIAEAFLPHIFGHFRQADTSITRRHGGLGLGLAIVRHLAELHGGRARAENRAGGGARLLVTLPLTLALDDADLSLPPHAARAPSLAGHRILVVDDERDAREVTAAILATHGADVETAADGAEALALAATLEISLVVSDIGMPRIDGYELLRALRARGYRGPAVALTAYVADEVRRRSVDAGYQAHLGKPCQPAELVSVAALLAGAHR